MGRRANQSLTGRPSRTLTLEDSLHATRTRSGPPWNRCGGWRSHPPVHLASCREADQGHFYCWAWKCGARCVTSNSEPWFHYTLCVAVVGSALVGVHVASPYPIRLRVNGHVVAVAWGPSPFKWKPPEFLPSVRGPLVQTSRRPHMSILYFIAHICIYIYMLSCPVSTPPPWYGPGGGGGRLLDGGRPGKKLSSELNITLHKA